jgi:hypothetical protein
MMRIEDLLIAFHAVDEEALQHPVKDMLKVVDGIHLGRGLQRLILDGCFGNLIKEKLIGLLEVRPKAIVELVDKL